MPVKHVIRNGLMKTIQVDDAGNEIGNAPRSTLADPNKALTFATNFEQANEDAQAAGTQLAPSTMQALDMVQSDQYLNKFGNPEVAGTAIYDLSNEIFNKLQAPIGLLNKLVVLRTFSINICIDDSGSMQGERWQQALNRLLEMMDILQVVPTGPVTISFLNRRDNITINRYGQTPAQFYQQARNWLINEFRRSPNGGTPIYKAVDTMLRNANGQTAHYLITDGVPTGYGNSQEDSEAEIRDVEQRIINRPDAVNNPMTLMCCSTNPRDTQWLHETEETACRPSRPPGYVAALQNFDAERLEVLNDQGAWLPYTRSVWLICSLVAALNPNDLDALDQHAPLSKPILDTFLGRVSTMSEYEGYFLQHPNATWLFKEDFELFVKTPITNQIQSVAFFENTLGNKLDAAIRRGLDNTEFSDLASTETMLLNQFSRQRPLVIYQQRQNFWLHYERMELDQLNALRYHPVVSQHIWADYVAYSGMGNIWQQYVQECHPNIQAVIQTLSQQQQQQQVVIEQQAAAQGEDAPPPPYSANAMTLSDPNYDSYSKPNYYSGSRGIQSVTVYNQSGSNQTMWRPSQSGSSQQYQAGGGGYQQYQPQQYRQESCCTLS